MYNHVDQTITRNAIVGAGTLRLIQDEGGVLILDRDTPAEDTPNNTDHTSLIRKVVGMTGHHLEVVSA